MSTPKASPALRSFLTALAFSAATAFAAGEEGTVSGRITQAGTHKALGSVTVSLDGTDLTTLTDRGGEFRFSHVTVGAHTLTLNYLGLPTKTINVVVSATGTEFLTAELGDPDTVFLETMSVDGVRTGQAKALNDQRSRSNLVNIVSSDLTGQFPDKTIADAIKRQPGITVETDTDTGGSEGRYVTIRGMAAGFNTVTINGVRVDMANADDTISRQAPLDVISAKSADSIVITKTIRPDQDADSIGGSVDIITQSAIDKAGPTASVEAAIGYKKILTDYSHYRYSNPNYEGGFTYGNTFPSTDNWGYVVSGNFRNVTSQKHRVSTLGWDNLSTTDEPLFMMDALALQDFFDHVANKGASVGIDGRINHVTKLHFNAAYNQRATVRGRQRQVIWFSDDYDPSAPGDFVDYITGTPTVTGDTVTKITTQDNRFTREAREFHETQSNFNASATGETRVGDTTLTFLAGVNRGQYKGDPNHDIWARFDTRFNSQNSYTIEPGSIYFPTFETENDRNDPSLYRMRALYLDTDVITDTESNFGLDAKIPVTVAGHRGHIKVGAKGRFRERVRDDITLAYRRNTSWTLAGYNGDFSAPSLVADYRANSLVNGSYDYGFYIDPVRTRATALSLIAAGLLTPDGENANNSKFYSYTANEDVGAAYALGEFDVTSKLSVMAGARVETTHVVFHTSQALTNEDGDVAVTPITDSRSYYNLTPGVHAKYDVSKSVTLRGALTRTIARPAFSDLNPREQLYRDETPASLSRGNIRLKPVISDNFDLSADYFNKSGVQVSLGLFYKKLQNNIYTPNGITQVIDGETIIVSEPRNALGGYLYGSELSFEAPLKFLPPSFKGLGFSGNWTYTESDVKTGIASNPHSDLFDQVKNTVNAGLFYENHGVRARLAWLYRSGSTPADYGIDANFAQLNRQIPASQALDFTVSYRLFRNWTIFGEVQNILNTPGRAYDGNSHLRLDYNEYSDLSAQLGLRWNL